MQTETGLLAARGCKERLRLARRLVAPSPRRLVAPDPSAGDVVGVRGSVSHASAAIDAWWHTRTGLWQRMAVRLYSCAPTFAHLRQICGASATSACYCRLLYRPRICSRACAPPNGMRHKPREPLLAAHAGVTGVQRPVRGGGAGPARGCGARSPAQALA
jgi:hypothetical protein